MASALARRLVAVAAEAASCSTLCINGRPMSAVAVQSLLSSSIPSSSLSSPRRFISSTSMLRQEESYEPRRRKGPSMEQQKQAEEGESKQEQSSQEEEEAEGAPRRVNTKRKKLMTFLTLAGVAAAGYYGYDTFVAEKTEEEKEEEALPFTERMKRKYQNTVDYFTKPTEAKLLPDAIRAHPSGVVPKHTLVVTLDHLLVNTEWSRDSGWRIQKRPYVDYFIELLSPYYEIVLWSKESPGYTLPIAMRLDGGKGYLDQNAILSREAVTWHKGKWVKDLSKLNRPLNKVVALDCEEEALSFNKDNGLIIPPWKGDSKDTGLFDIIPTLQEIAYRDLPDVRPILEKLREKDILAECKAARIRRFLEEEEKKAKQPEKKSWIPIPK